MSALYAPLLRIQVVGAVAQILGEPQGCAVPCYQNYAARSVGRKCYCLFAQIGYGLWVVCLYGREGLAVECRA